MIDLLPHSLWSIEPMAMSALHAQVQQVLRSTQSISSGPAQDAERAGLPLRTDGSVAVVSMYGPMMKGRVGWMNNASTEATRAAILSAGADDSIESIVWRVGSPGGSVEYMDRLADSVDQVVAIKPIIVQVEGTMASAAVYVTAGATEIRCGRMDMVGSIGTKLVLYDYSKMYSDAGVRPIVIDTGPFKSAGEPGTEVTEEQTAYFQGIVGGFFADFESRMGAGRGISGADFKAVSDGKMWLASDALKLGLIDKVSTFEETMSGLRGSPKGRSTASARARLSMQRGY